MRIALIVAYTLSLQQTRCSRFHLDSIITDLNQLQQILSHLGLHVDNDQHNARLYSNIPSQWKSSQALDCAENTPAAAPAEAL
jgi:hypothetical protein